MERKMRNFVVLVLASFLLLAGVLVLPASGKSDVTVDLDKPVSLTMWFLDWKAGILAVEAGVEIFQKEYPNINIELTPVPQANLIEKWLPAYKAGNEPDVCVQPNHLFRSVDPAAVLLRLDPDVFTKAEYKRLFFEAMGNPIIGSDGHIYGIPDPDPVDGTGFAVNIDILEEVGVDYRDLVTWDAIIDAAQKAVKWEDGKMVRAGLQMRHVVSDGNYFTSGILELGGSFYDEKTHTFDFTTPEAERALQFLVDLIRVEEVTDPEWQPNFFNGSAAMMTNGPAHYSAAKQVFNQNATYIMRPPIPGAKKGWIYTDIGPSFFVFSGRLADDALKYPAAVQYGKFLSSREWAQVIGQHYFAFQANREFMLNDYVEYEMTAPLKPIVDAMNQGQFVYVPHYISATTLLSGIFNRYYELAIRGEMTVQEALEKIEEEANAAEEEAYQTYLSTAVK